MQTKMGIIADDLTGSNDSGVQLAKKGFNSTVVMDIDTNVHSHTDVLIVDTDSRGKAEGAAYEAVSKAASLLFQQGFDHIYKKVDSTLRGNIAAELASAVHVYQPEAVVVAPAFPKLNRTTLNGKHYVNGQLITETEFGRDPKTPVTESYIPDLLKVAIKEKIVLLDASLLRGPKEETISFIKKELSSGRAWFVCDAEKEADLKLIAEIFAGIEKKTVWAGSGGLIDYLPEALKLDSEVGQQREEISVRQTLIVSGSLSQVTKSQLESLQRAEQSYFIEVNPVDLVNDSLDIDSLLREAGSAGEESQFILYVDSSEENRMLAKEAGAANNLTANQVSERIATGLGKAARIFLEKADKIDGLILTGGDTAKAVCQELGVSEMELLSEVEPGLPFGRIKSGARNYWAVTKAGGFGKEDSLMNAVNYMIERVEKCESK
jgi:D-threonate/D-erythronate kinase